MSFALSKPHPLRCSNCACPLLQRPGRCYACGQEGHWSGECPQRGRAPPPRLPADDPAALAARQRPDPQHPLQLRQQQQQQQQQQQGGAGAGMGSGGGGGGGGGGQAAVVSRLITLLRACLESIRSGCKGEAWVQGVGCHSVCRRG